MFLLWCADCLMSRMNMTDGGRERWNGSGGSSRSNTLPHAHAPWLYWSLGLTRQELFSLLAELHRCCTDVRHCEQHMDTLMNWPIKQYQGLNRTGMKSCCSISSFKAKLKSLLTHLCNRWLLLCIQISLVWISILYWHMSILTQCVWSTVVYNCIICPTLFNALLSMC